MNAACNDTKYVLRARVCVSMILQWLDENKTLESEDEEAAGGFALAMRVYMNALNWVLQVRTTLEQG